MNTGGGILLLRLNEWQGMKSRHIQIKNNKLDVLELGGEEKKYVTLFCIFFLGQEERNFFLNFFPHMLKKI